MPGLRPASSLHLLFRSSSPPRGSPGSSPWESLWQLCRVWGVPRAFQPCPHIFNAFCKNRHEHVCVKLTLGMCPLLLPMGTGKAQRVQSQEATCEHSVTSPHITLHNSTLPVAQKGLLAQDPTLSCLLFVLPSPNLPELCCSSVLYHWLWLMMKE